MIGVVIFYIIGCHPTIMICFYLIDLIINFFFSRSNQDGKILYSFLLVQPWIVKALLWKLFSFEMDEKNFLGQCQNK